MAETMLPQVMMGIDDGTFRFNYLFANLIEPGIQVCVHDCHKVFLANISHAGACRSC